MARRAGVEGADRSPGDVVIDAAAGVVVDAAAKAANPTQ
jgi:hypothetical protein